MGRGRPAPGAAKPGEDKAAQWMADHAGDGMILIDDSGQPGAHGHRRRLRPGGLAPFSGRRWTRMFREAGRAEWLYIEAESPQDQVQRAIGRDPTFADDFVLRYRSGSSAVLPAPGCASMREVNTDSPGARCSATRSSPAGGCTRGSSARTLQGGQDEGSRLGTLVQTEFGVSRRDVFSALADTWGLPLVDLIEQPPDDDLVREIGAEALLASSGSRTTARPTRSGWRPPSGQATR